jgi:poly-gamma-glutamate synthase PgsB/CapB
MSAHRLRPVVSILSAAPASGQPDGPAAPPAGPRAATTAEGAAALAGPRTYGGWQAVAAAAALFGALAYYDHAVGIGWRGMTPVFGAYAMIIILLGTLSFVLVAGLREQRRHFERLARVPIRVHVNGIRGKSTVTRMIGSALREAGYKTLTKTTGKAARLIGMDGREAPIVRTTAPNIREQKRVVELAVAEGADALVIECMAVRPELQRVSEQKLVRATIGVITNVRPDHLDVMGPTLPDVAANLCNTLPAGGALVTAEERYIGIIEENARRTDTRVIRARPELVPDGLLARFPYMNFKENVAIALEVTRLLGIPDEVAVRGMLGATPDPGLLQVYRTSLDGVPFTFVNAMGVNDRESTVLVYRDLVKRGILGDSRVVGLFHARGDRAFRTADFGGAMATDMSFERIIAVGVLTGLFVSEALKAGYPRERLEDLGAGTAADALGAMKRTAGEYAGDGRQVVIFACGNMVGELPRQMLEAVSRGAAA